MLRRHLKSGGAPVAACAGFDFDTASAYLEDALVRPERANYESHLAGCAACRRHLIELSHLAQTDPHAGTKPATVADQAPAWVRWREVIAGWFDLPGWNWKWQMVGAGGAAFAILIAALGVQSWRQGTRQTDSAIAANTDGAISGELKIQAPAPEPSPQGTPLLEAGDSIAIYQKNMQPSVPEPPPAVGPKESEPNVAVALASESSKLNAPQPSGALPFNFSAGQETPAETRQKVSEVQQNPVIQPATPVMLVADSGNAGKQVVAERDEASNDITARMTPPPGINPMYSDPPPPPPKQRGKQQHEKLSSRLSGFARTFLPGGSESESQSGRKPKLEPLDDESFKPLTVRIRNKVFRFDKDMWIDQDYKPEMQRWRVLPVKRGSKQYEQILADDPLLKEFFNQGPILVIWKDKIYKVQ